MSPRVGRLDPVVLVNLFTRLNAEIDPLARGVEQPARAFVQREFGVDPVLVGLHEPVCAVEGCRRLFAAGEGEFDVVAGAEALLLVSDHGVREAGRHRLVVGDAASVEVAAFLDQGEGIPGPVLTLGFDHVDMGEEQDALRLRVAAVQHGDQSALLGVIGACEDMDVGIGVAGGLQALGHALRRQGAVALGEGRVGLDQFLVQGAERRFRRVRTRGLSGARRRQSHRNGGENP